MSQIKDTAERQARVMMDRMSMEYKMEGKQRQAVERLLAHDLELAYLAASARARDGVELDG